MTALRFEMNHPSDFTTAYSLKPYVKDVYLQYKKDNSTLRIGIIGNPSFDAYHRIWGYRSVEAYPMGLYKHISSRDFGIGYEYNSEKLSFQAIYGNGEGIRNEVNEGKSLSTLVSYGGKTGLYGEIFLNFNNNKESMYHAFLAYQADKARLGIMYGRKDSEIDDVKADYNVLSIFWVFSLSEQINAFLRYDKTFEPNPSGDKVDYLRISAFNPSNYIVAGLAYSINDKIDIIPNIQYVFYDEEDGIDTDSDLIIRLTLSYCF